MKDIIKIVTSILLVPGAFSPLGPGALISYQTGKALVLRKNMPVRPI